MILSDLDILRVNAEGAMISPFCEEHLQGASYDLTMTDTITAFKEQVRTIDLRNQMEIDRAYSTEKIPAEGYVLQPGEYVLVSLKETLTIPTNMTAHIRPRTRFTRLGILVSAQHCNPGYSGVLQLGLYNASPNAVILTPGLKIAQAVFEDLKSTPSPERQYQNKKDAAYQDERDFRGAVFDDSEMSPDARALYKKILKKMEEA